MGTTSEKPQPKGNTEEPLGKLGVSGAVVLCILISLIITGVILSIPEPSKQPEPSNVIDASGLADYSRSSIIEPTATDAPQPQSDDADPQIMNRYYEPTQDTPEPAQDERVAIADTYLAGTPMAGTGAIVVAASDNYGIDFRSTLAIAKLESGCGQKCFLPYNAWGWGRWQWSSWETAIWGFSEGFSKGYGSALSEVGARAYVGTEHWHVYYVSYCNEMLNIYNYVYNRESPQIIFPD